MVEFGIFVLGLVIGALIGAALVWEHRHPKRESPLRPPAPAPINRYGDETCG